jgi:hypothetical protein
MRRKYFIQNTLKGFMWYIIQQRWKIAWLLTAALILWGAEVFCWHSHSFMNVGLVRSVCRIVLAVWLKNGLSSHGSRREVPACLRLLSRLLRQVQLAEPLTVVTWVVFECKNQVKFHWRHSSINRHWRRIKHAIFTYYVFLQFLE